MYDVARGRPSKIDVEWNPFQRLDTPFRARRAIRLGAVACWVICGDYLLNALIIRQRVIPFPALISTDPATLAAVQCALALAAGGLALLMRNRPRVWTGAIVLVWAICEVVRPITVHLYGHGAPKVIAGLVLMLAVLGFRGALALRQLPSVP